MITHFPASAMRRKISILALAYFFTCVSVRSTPIAFFISERLKLPDPDACFMALLRFCVICAVTLIPDKAASLESVDACRIYRPIEIENAMMVM